MPRALRWRTPPNVPTWLQDELSAGRKADPRAALERAHIVSQPWPWPHTRVHGAMPRVALTQRDRREALGQLIRIAVAGPGSVVGRYPPGNTGRTTMALTGTAPIPADLTALLP